MHEMLLDNELEQIQYIASHNGTNFDLPIYKRVCEELNLEPLFLEKTHIDTSIDIPFPENISTRKLTYLAFEHGFMMQNAHRAIFDTFGCGWLLSFYKDR